MHILARILPRILRCAICLAITAALPVHADDVATLATALGSSFVANPVHVGLSLGIVAHGETRQFHFGSIERGQAIAPTGQTIYELASPGSTYAYSNAGAQLIGLLLERVYGANYAALLRRTITAPHQMPDTGTIVAPHDATRHARRYDGHGRAMPGLAFWRSLPAAGYLKSTLNDQLRYLAWNLDASDPVVALAHRVAFRHTSERGDDIGLFWFVNRSARGMRLVRHAGGSFGTTTFELLYPDAGIGVVLLANDADGSTEKTLASLADALADALADTLADAPAN